MSRAYQYCYLHKEMEEYPACATSTPEAVRYSKSTQLPKNERPVIFENPQTGEVRYPATPDSPMMPGYAERGFERREFNSYQEHKSWCDSHGVVNHQVEGIKDSVLDK